MKSRKKKRRKKEEDEEEEEENEEEKENEEEEEEEEEEKEEKEEGGGGGGEIDILKVNIKHTQKEPSLPPQLVGNCKTRTSRLLPSILFPLPSSVREWKR